MKQSAPLRVASLDIFQERVVHSRARAIRVIAPAGSGKTEALVRRCVDRVGRDKRAADRIRVLSFSESSATTFRKRFKQLSPSLPQPKIERLGSFAFRILEDCFKEEVPPPAGRDREKNKGLISRVKHELEREFLDTRPLLTWDGHSRSLEKTLDQLKEQGFSPAGKDSQACRTWLRVVYLGIPTADRSLNLSSAQGLPLWNETTDAILDRVLKAYSELDARLRARDLMEIADARLRANWSLHANPRIRDTIRDSIDELIVDEFQDISRLDALFLWQLIGNHTRIVIAGDDDQAIFDWRGGTAQFLLETEERFKIAEIETIELGINYRTPDLILKPAQRLIEHNQSRFPKQSTSSLPTESKIELVASPTTRQLDTAIAEVIADILSWNKQLTDTRVLPRDVAVLCANVSVRDRIGQALRSIGVPFMVAATSMLQTSTPGKVMLTTILNGKSHEWPVVILPDCSDSLVPGPKIHSTADIEAERRKMYVGMTRASQRLVIGYVEPPNSGGPSRFLIEAGLVIPANLQDYQPTGTKPQSLVDRVRREIPRTAQYPPEKCVEPATVLSDSGATHPNQSLNPQISSNISDNRNLQPSNIRSVHTSDGNAASRPWDLTQDERDAYNEYLQLLNAGLLKESCINTWQLVVAYLRRCSGQVDTRARSEYIAAIDIAFQKNLIDSEWKDKLHEWRKLRNRTKEKLSTKFINNHDRITIHEMAYGIPDIVACVTSRMLVTPAEDAATFMVAGNDKKLLNAYRAFEEIAGGNGKPPKKSVSFDISENAEMVVLLQMIMVLRDIRFRIDVKCAWNTSPIVFDFVSSVVGTASSSFVRSDPTHSLNLHGHDRQAAVVRLGALVHRELGEHEFETRLRLALLHARDVGNGRYTKGIVFTPIG